MGIKSNEPVRCSGPLTADGAVFAGAGRLCGVALSHTVATVVAVHDDTAANAGTRIATCNVAANSSNLLWFGDEGIPVTTGLYVDWTAGVAYVYYKR